MTQQPPTPPMGERRRRREAERRAAQASGARGLNPPMTRRERRALEEALASGALELTPDGQYVPTGEVPVTTTGLHVLGGMESARSASEAPAGQAAAAAAGTTDASADAASADTASAGQSPAPERTGEASAPEPPSSPPDPPERQSWRDTAQEVDALRPPPTMAPLPDGGTPAAEAPSPASAGSAEQPNGPGRVSRRSLRELRQDAGGGVPEGPGERTATGRRPVIRPPASALGTRSVDGATGELSAIQRAIRDINAAPEDPPTDSVLHDLDTESPETGAPENLPDAAESPAAPEPSASGPTQGQPSAGSPAEGFATEAPADASAPSPAATGAAADAPSATTPPAAGAPDAAADAPAGAHSTATPVGSPSSTGSPEDDEIDDSFDMSPRWPSLAAVAEQVAEESKTPAEAGGDPAATVDVDEDTTPSPPPEDDDLGHEPAVEDFGDAEEEGEDERHTPRLLQVLYWLVLVLAGLVLGLLVWRMATGDLFGDGDALAAGARMLVLRQ